MLRQFAELKTRVPDALLFFRMGDFYELFFEDAELAAKLLDLTLTARDKSGANPVPMAGVPHHAVRGYISRLVLAGHKVAIADQLEDPRLAKGIVKRGLTEIITPGTILEPDNLDARAANYLVALHPVGEVIGLAAIDVSTGEFSCTDLHPDAVPAELDRLDPSEILTPEALSEDELVQGWKDAVDARWAAVPDHAFRPSAAKEELLALYGLRDLDGLGVDDVPCGVVAAGAVLHYLRAAQLDALGHVRRLRAYRLDGFMVLDESTRRNLELFRTMADGKRRGSLVGLLDRCVTGMGSRRLRRWLGAPLLRPQEIGERLEAVSILVTSSGLRDALRERLAEVSDVERLNAKITSGRATGRDLAALRRSLNQAPALDVLLDREDTRALPLFAELPDLSDVAADLRDALSEDPPVTLKDGGLIRAGYHGELDELVQLARDGKGSLAQLEADERKATGIHSLKVRYNRVFGYYIEVTKANLANVPDHYIRKQTLANAERYFTEELKEFESKVLGAEERRRVLELELFSQLRERTSARAAQLSSLADRIADLDAVVALAEVAVKYDYCRPTVDDSLRLTLKAGRHPVIEQMRLGERFVPNDVTLDHDGDQMLIVSGPNMAGKSTVMRQVALITLLAQIGSFVPAEEAHIGVVDRIFTRVGASDNLARGQSTFMVEMSETAAILNNATDRSLAILDEIGRGTSTYDGVAIAWAVAEYIADTLKCRTMFATHYHELAELAETRPNVANVNIAVSELAGRVIFLRRLRPGGASRSYGIQVARLAGLPEPVLARAREVLANLELDARNEVGAPRRARGKQAPEAHTGQLSLFGDRSAILKAELLALQPDQLTPLEALTILAQLRLKAEEC
jgi:DNA mismatch repair protein MutS